LKSAAGQHAQGRSIQLFRTLLGLGVILSLGALESGATDQGPNSSFPLCQAATCRLGSMPARHSSRIDGAGAGRTVRLVSVPKTRSPQAQQSIRSKVGNPQPTQEFELERGRAHIRAAGITLAREDGLHSPATVTMSGTGRVAMRVGSTLQRSREASFSTTTCMDDVMRMATFEV
jgi:hypothetical protein